MNTKTDSPFVQAVNRCCESLNVYPGARPGCDECGLSEVTDYDDPAVEMAEEGSFSWHSCDTCGTRLGGMRTPGHGTARDNTHVHLNICYDCVVYLANGDEPEDWP